MVLVPRAEENIPLGTYDKVKVHVVAKQQCGRVSSDGEFPLTGGRGEGRPLPPLNCRSRGSECDGIRAWLDLPGSAGSVE
jgi:hypothetical protein